MFGKVEIGPPLFGLDQYQFALYCSINLNREFLQKRILMLQKKEEINIVREILP